MTCFPRYSWSTMCSFLWCFLSIVPQHDFMGETDVDIRPLLQTPNKDVNVELKLTAGAKTLDDGKVRTGPV